MRPWQRKAIPLRPTTMLTAIIRDLRYSARRLWAHPASTILLVLTLALGIGANTAVFSAIAGLVIKPLPYPDSERLIQIYNSYPKRGDLDSKNSTIDYLDRRAQADALADITLYYEYGYDLTVSAAPVRLQGVAATHSLFTTLGVEARLGRTFSEEDAIEGNERVVVLSDGLWRTQFGADPSVVGKQIPLRSEQYEVIGVMPVDFGFPRPQVQLWVPIALTQLAQTDAARGFDFAYSIGRLKPTATIGQLEAQFDAIIQGNIERLGGEHSSVAGGNSWAARAIDSGFTARAVPLHQYLLGDRASTLWLLQVTVALVLAIACANVANLMLISLHQRRRELSVRAAFGASRWELSRQLLIESALISALGGALGLLVAVAGLGLLRASGLDGAAAGFAVELDLTVLTFAVACMALSTLVCGLAPTIGLRHQNHSSTLKAGARGSLSSKPARRLRAALVVAQVGLSIALLAGGGLLLRSFLQLSNVDPGFQQTHLLSISGDLSRVRFRDPEETRRFLDGLLSNIRELPGVQSVGLTGDLPFSGDTFSSAYFIDGDQPGDGRTRLGNPRVIDEALFQTMGIPLLKGRGFAASDDTNAPAVTIIDAELAREAFGDRDPIGQRIGTGPNDSVTWFTVVGIVGSVKFESLAQQTKIATFYLPYRRSNNRYFKLVIKTPLTAAQLAEPIRDAARRVDPEQPLYDLISMQERIDRSLDTQRRPLQLVMIFAAIALGLAAIGIYAVLAFGVAQRRGEIGVRLSIGAQRADIVWLILVDGGRMVAMGVALGAVIWFAMATVLRSQLYQVGVGDPFTLACVLTMVVLVALLAMWIPARRAAATEPSQALRAE